MKITCDVIKDLLPLYVENISSDDTRILVEEHLVSCESCKRELNKMNTPKGVSLGTNVLPLKKLKIALLKRKYLTILLSVLLTILVLIITMGYITTPEYIPYSEKPVSITKAANNSVIVHFEVPSARYKICKYRAEDNSGDIYEISTWKSIWNRNLYKDSPQDFILNPYGETVSSVYYCSNNGNKDILIYGKDQNPTGGQITLPRLVLSYYFTIAVVGAVILGVILFLFRKKRNAKVIIFKLFALPISYLLAHICIKGFTGISYSATRDFFAILLAMIPIYCVILIGYKLIIIHKSK
jgi:Predicted integral membrane protein